MSTPASDFNESGRKGKMSFKLILSLILIGLAVLFVVQNVAVVEIQFLIWSVSVSRALLIFIILAMGILTGWLLHSYADYRQRGDKSSLDRHDNRRHGLD